MRIRFGNPTIFGERPPLPWSNVLRGRLGLNPENSRAKQEAPAPWLAWGIDHELFAFFTANPNGEGCRRAYDSQSFVPPRSLQLTRVDQAVAGECENVSHLSRRSFMIWHHSP